ncbi:MAG: hypothetical protein HY775_01885 [Acidobacteria bacterium]|nr:hypothetical protein [Acidobacteriota bacterium]
MMAARSFSLARPESGGIVTSWLLRLLIILALFGVAVFEAGSVLIARVQVDGIAIDAATEAGSEYARFHSEAAAERAAEDVARRSEARVVDFRVSADGREVIVTVEKRAKTIFIHKIEALRRWTLARSTHSAPVQ